LIAHSDGVALSVANSIILAGCGIPIAH